MSLVFYEITNKIDQAQIPALRQWLDEICSEPYIILDDFDGARYIAFTESDVNAIICYKLTWL